jgi:hypothetical protein
LGEPKRRGKYTEQIRVNDYGALRDYLKKQSLPELVLSYEQIEEIIDAALPRAAQRASWWDSLRSPRPLQAAEEVDSPDRSSASRLRRRQA